MSVHISEEVLVALLILIFSSILTIVLHHKLKILQNYHQVPISIIVGAIVGTILLLSFNFKVKFSSEGFFNFILPPMCFQAGFNLKGHRAIANIVYLLLYGIFGTLLSMACFSIGLTYLENFYKNDPQFHMDAYHTLILASFLSNWETHTCILILEEKEYPTLTSIMFGERFIFGETMINDAVVVGMVSSINTMREDFKEVMDVTIVQFGKIMAELCRVGLLSLLLGIGISFFMCFILRLMRKTLAFNGYLQMMYVLIVAYASFMVSELCHLAGALTIFCSGFIMSYYAFNSMTPRAQTLTKVTVHFLGYVPESFIFAYIGLTVPTNFFQNMGEFLWVISIIVSSIFVRAFTVIFLFFVGALIHWKFEKYTLKSAIMLIMGGLIRGSIPFALSMTLIDSKQTPDNIRQAEFVSRLLLLTIFLTTPTLGGGVKLWTKCLGLTREPYDMAILKEGDVYATFLHGTVLKGEVIISKKYRKVSCFERFWTCLNQRVLKPLFGQKEKNEDPETKEAYESVKLTILNSIIGDKTSTQKGNSQLTSEVANINKSSETN